MKFLCLVLFLFGVVPAGAGLEFESALIKVDAGLNDKTVTRDFHFTNRGDKAVSIKQADGGCSCLQAQVAGGKLGYAPGESGTIRVVFEVGSFQGTVDKNISVWLDGDPEDKPSTTLTMSVTIPVIIQVEPKTVKWEVGSPAAPKVIDVMMNYEKPIHITAVATSNGTFSAKLTAVEEGKHYRIEVTPEKGTDSAALSIIRIETDVDVEKQRVQQGFAVISSQPKER